MHTDTVKAPSYGKWPGADFMEYLLVVQPDEAVYGKVTNLRGEFYDEFGVSAEAGCGLSVAGFLAKEEMEDTLIRWIQRVCGQYKSFPLQLNNFSGIPPHTVYIRVQDPLAFQGLGQHLKAVDDFLDPPLRLTSKPHLTIASRLSLAVYEKAIKKYAQEEFHETFLVTELVLLKRGHPLDSFKKVNVFRLAP